MTGPDLTSPSTPPLTAPDRAANPVLSSTPAHHRPLGKRLRDQPIIHLLPFIALLCGLLASFVDRPLAFYCKMHLSPHWEGFFKVLTELGGGRIWYTVAGGAFLLWRLQARWSRQETEEAQLLTTRSRAALWLLTAMLGSGLLVEGLKIAFGRIRPRLLFEQNLYGLEPFNGLDWARQSFPSGHSQTIWVVVTVLVRLWPNCRLAFIVIGGIVSASRVATTVHYLSDVIMGAFLGIACAMLLRDFFLVPMRTQWKRRC